MASNKSTGYQPWSDKDSKSYEIALRVVCIAASTFAALIVALYVYTQRSHRLKNYAAVTTLCASHASMIVQAGLLVAACAHGYGAHIRVPSAQSIHKADQLFFASNVLLVIVWGLSRASVCLTLQQGTKQTDRAKYALGVSVVLLLWLIGSIIGVIVNRAVSNGSFWIPVGQDFNFTLWICIVLTGLAIDLAIAAISITLVAGLQMSIVKKIYTVSVFGVGILMNVPLIYGVSYLYQHSSQLAEDPTWYADPFIYANQAAIAISLWSRALEAARSLQKDVGYATFGLRTGALDPNYGSSRGYGQNSRNGYGSNSRNGYAGPSYTPHNYMSKKDKRPLEEDEVELHDRKTRYTASVKGEGTSGTDADHSSDGIEVTRQVWIR